MLRIGIVSAAHIAPDALVAPAALNPDVKVTAVAARDRTRAEEFASAHGIENVLDTYDDLCATDLVDAVYVATPAALHREWTVKALAAGKHVLCEKPIGANAEDARAMVDAGRQAGLVMMEAFHWRYHPMAEMIRRIVDQELGRVIHIEASFTVGHIPDDDIRFDLALGGGALMDLGVYPLQWARFVAGSAAQPAVVSAHAAHVRGLVDVEIEAQLSFAENFTARSVAGVQKSETTTVCSARIHCSMVSGVPVAASLRVEGERGTLHVTNPLAPQMGNDLHVVTAAGERHETAPFTTTYSHQLMAFVDAVERGIPVPTGGADSVTMMSTVDEIYTAAGLGPRPSWPTKR